jgi:exonuclease III
MTELNTGLNRLGIGSFNCNRSLYTRRDIIAQTIINRGINILALQDTGLTSIGDETSVRSFFLGQGYTFYSKAWLPSNTSTEYSQDDLRALHRYFVQKGHHHSDERSRLGILVHRSIAVYAETVYTGLASPRLQALKICLPGRNFCLVNIYAPIADEMAANHRDLNAQLAGLRATLGEHVIILGDRNAVTNPSVDRYPAGGRMSDQDDALLNSLLECRVVDFFRVVSPSTPGFTFAHNGHCSRIDSIAGSPELADLLVDCLPLRAFLSDHDMVAAFLAISVAPVQRCARSDRVQFAAPKCSPGPPS